MNQRGKMKAKLEQQSRDQSDISQYLRNKLKDNYANIAELETKANLESDVHGAFSSRGSRTSKRSSGRSEDICCYGCRVARAI